jgi:histidinol-phosphate/aromatic aminotransferase/cobyric acid decarboxylase-like protein
MDLDTLRQKHGGYWRYPSLDFHYLFNQYFPPRELLAELQQAVLTLANSYPSSQAVLCELLADWKDASYAAAENLIVGNGSSELIKFLMDRVVTRVTVPLPTFNEFTTGSPGSVHRYALNEADGFVLDVERLLHEVSQSHSDYAVIINPNNPVGSLVPVGDVCRILESGVRLIVDEAFMAFADPAHSAERLVEQYDNLIVVTSLTKSIGIAGLRLGYVLTTNREVQQRLRRALPIWNVNSLAEYVLEALPRYRTEHEQSLARIRDDTQWFAAELQHVAYLEPFPTYSNAVFCRVEGSGRRLAELLFDRHGFVVKEGIRQAELTSVRSYVRLGVRNRSDNGRLLDALHGVTQPDLDPTSCRSTAHMTLTP